MRRCFPKWVRTTTTGLTLVSRAAEKKRQELILSANPQTVGGLKVLGLETTDGFKYDLEDGGFLLIRFSGTEPIIRVYTETMHQDRVQDILKDGLKVAGIQ